MNVVPTIAVVDGSWLLVVNGQPVEGRHAAEADRVAIHLAYGRRCHPVLLGTGMTSGVTWEWTTLVPPGTDALGFGLLVSGRGEVQLTSSGDTYDCVIPVDVGGSTAADATWVFVDERKTVAANGSWRCLEPGDDTQPAETDLAMTITDGSGATLTVWQVVTRPMPRVSPLA